MENNNSAGLSDGERINSIMAILDKDEVAEPATKNTDNEMQDPTVVGAELTDKKEAISEGQNEKTNEQERGELQKTATIEPPASWPSDDKEAFRSLPTWAQERINARESERESYFAERSQTIAARERDIQDIQAKAGKAQEQYMSELGRLNQLATQLMPAKFSDIKSEADYLQLKVSNPARASEYEAFVQVLQRANQQSQQVMQEKQKEHLDREYSMLTQKYPEFQDNAKATTLLNEVRKAAVDWYSFRPEEVAIIADHRYVPIIRDAIAWRNYQVNLKAAEGKKVPSQQPTNVLRNNATTNNSSISSDQKNKIFNQASKTTDMRKKAALIASLI